MNQTKICTNCKIEKSIIEFSKKKGGKFGVAAICKGCEKQYRQANAESIADRMKQYRKENKEYISAKKKQYQQANKIEIAEYKKQYRQANKQHIAEQMKQYTLDNKEAKAKYNKQYYQTPTGKAVKKAASHNRRARKLQNGGKHTGTEILQLFDQQSSKCPYCKVKLYKTGKNIFHSDHIVPLSKGGSNDISNIQLLCPKCNMSKHDKLPEEFAANFGKLF